MIRLRPVVSNLTITGEGTASVRDRFRRHTDSSISRGADSSTADGARYLWEKECHWGETREDRLIHYLRRADLDIAQRSGGDPSAVYLQVWDWRQQGTVVDSRAAGEEWKWEVLVGSRRALRGWFLPFLTW